MTTANPRQPMAIPNTTLALSRALAGTATGSGRMAEGIGSGEPAGASGWTIGVPQCTQYFHSGASSLRQIGQMSTLRSYQLTGTRTVTL